MSSIPGAGTTSEENRYHFYHHNPEPGIHYYRLSQVDINGVEEFSDIISVTHNVNDNCGDFTQLYPNPVIDFCNVTYRGNNYSSPIQIKIYSMNGEQVYHSEVDNFNNSTGISIPVENLFNGVYIIELSQDGISERQRINVMK